MLCACGVENASNAKFCKGCGNKFQLEPSVVCDISKPCPACQAILKPEAKFCGKCGYKFITEPVEIVPAVQSAPLVDDLATVTQSKIVNIPEDVATIEDDGPSLVPVESNTSMVSGINKKTIILTALALTVIGGASLAWVSLRELGTTAAPVAKVGNATPVPATPDVAKLELSQKSISVPVPTAPTTPVKDVQSLTSKYIGRIIKDGAKFDKYQIGLIGKSGNFRVLSAYEDDDEGALMYTKLVLITDQAGKVLDSKDVPENGSVLVDGKNACVINKKPYIGVYALSSMKSKLTTPAAVWMLNDNGMLVNQAVKGVECGMYVEFMPESDEIKAITGYNDLHKIKSAEAQPAINNKPAKIEQKAAIVTTKKPASQKNEPKVITPAEPRQEQQPHTQQQEPTNQDEPQKKQNNSLSGLFEKLGESVKKGATERVCSAAERSMGQCN